MDADDIVFWIIAVLYVAYQVWARIKKQYDEVKERGRPQAQPEPQPEDDWYHEQLDAEPLPDESPVVMPTAAVDPWAAERQVLTGRMEGLIAEGTALAQAVRRDRATHRFAETLQAQVVSRSQSALEQVARPGEPVPDWAYGVADEVELVLAQIVVFVQQRRDAQLLAQLGDADALALRCYEPLFDFARAHQVGLTSGVPVTQLGGYELAIWTGFLPTGLAPIFLPVGFFEELYWWPAIAHEIGHDFLAASPSVDARLRAQLGLPDEEQGSMPLRFSRDAIKRSELERIFGGWLEEIFCDVFGTLMLGPAYGYAMEALFARPDDPSRVLRIRRDRTGRRYDAHPPRHLRVIMVAAVLDLAGQQDDAQQLLTSWAERHGGEPQVLILKRRGADISLPLAPVVDIALQLVARIYGQQLDALAGYRLADIPGLDWGPHEESQAKNVKDAVLAGRVPRTSNPRSVIAGAVLARRDAPDKARAMLTLARRAIAAVGTAEHAPDAYAMSDADLPAAGHLDLREAFILHTVLAPPPSARRGGAARRRGGLVGRRW